MLPDLGVVVLLVGDARIGDCKSVTEFSELDRLTGASMFKVSLSPSSSSRRPLTLATFLRTDVASSTLFYVSNHFGVSST
jgi:hypothetical protein